MKHIFFIIFVFTGVHIFSQDINPEINLSRYLFKEIRIWGFSEDGKIAYTSERPYPGGGIEFIIYDLEEKKILWDFPVDISLNENSQFYYDLNGEHYVRFKEETIQGYRKKMGEYNIIGINTEIEFRNFPIVTAGGEFYCNVIVYYNYFHAYKIDNYSIEIDDRIRARITPVLDIGSVTLCGYFVEPIGNSIILAVVENTVASDPHYKFIKVKIE